MTSLPFRLIGVNLFTILKINIWAIIKGGPFKIIGQIFLHVFLALFANKRNGDVRRINDNIATPLSFYPMFALTNKIRILPAKTDRIMDGKGSGTSIS